MACLAGRIHHSGVFDRGDHQGRYQGKAGLFDDQPAVLYRSAAALATSLAVEAGLLHIVMHATAKITLFFCAGAIYVGAHLNKVSQLDGLGPRMPLVFIAFTLGALSIIGIPPMGVELVEILLMAGAVDAGLPLMVAVLAVSSLLNVYYLLEPVLRAFFRPVNREIEINTPVLTVLPPVLTAIISL